MDVAMTIVSNFVTKQCSADVRFDVSEVPSANLTGAMRCLLGVKEKAVKAFDSEDSEDELDGPW